MERTKDSQLRTVPLVEASWVWIEAVLGFLYPNLCQICRVERATAREGFVCAACRGKPGALQFIEPPFCGRCGLPFEGDITNDFECTNCRQLKLHFQYARAAVAARGLALEIIHRFKYRQARWFEPFLADLLIRQATPVLQQGQWDAIVPIPLHPLKYRERGFNQAECLARRLSKATGIPLETRLLKRVIPTRTQTRLTREERAINVAKAFVYKGKRPLEGRQVVLVDDVFTTGATSNACAKVLQRNGSANICVWTVARGL